MDAKGLFIHIFLSAIIKIFINNFCELSGTTVELAEAVATNRSLVGGGC